MICILAFIVFLILFPVLGFFPKYRELFKKSWACVFKRVTLKPCDVDFSQELKTTVLSKIIFRYPRLAKFLDKTFSFWAFVFVVINVWSIWYTANAALNLYVYDTCDPISGESCSLSGEACGVGEARQGLVESVQNGNLLEWTLRPITDFTTALSQVPDRLKEWKAEDYIADSATYYQGFEEEKSIALEIIDPGCISCKNLFENIKKSDNFNEKYNLTYILYPIPDSTQSSGYKFANSYLRASYLEATKEVPLEDDNSNPGDWRLLEKLFTEEGNLQDSLQDEFNYVYSEEEAEKKLQEMLLEIGYTPQEAESISELAGSKEIQERLSNQKKIVEEEVNTIRIPTVIVDGRRYDRVLDEETLNGL